MDQITTLGLQKKTKREGGFLIQGTNIIPELKSVFIEAPAGLITIFGTFYGMRIYEADDFTEAVYSYGDLYTYDHVLKKYDETGLGINSRFTLLLQGQSESDILTVAPYSNLSKTFFLRNGSYYNTVPIGNILGSSYQYPDSWPTPGVFPTTSESTWVSIPGTDLIYDGAINSNHHHEVVRLGHLSNNSSLGGRTMFSDQLISTFKPTATSIPLPVTAGYMEVQPVRFTEYPFQSSVRYFGTIVQYAGDILSYDRIDLSIILPDINDPPGTHSGSLMPADLRTIALTDPICSMRPAGAFVAFSKPGELPTLFTIIDFTSTEQKKYAVNPPSSNSSDQEFFENNIEERKWRISCHWYNMETGETWSFTADQFWDLLRDRVRNLSIVADWRVGTSRNDLDEDWHAALAVLWQFFGRPTHNFQVPHDTWTFHAEEDEIYTWTRYYGNIKIDKVGIHGLQPNDIRVPAVATVNDGIRPTIRYSGYFEKDEGGGAHRYICVCEKLERLTQNEDLPQGQKEIKGIFVGTPFAENGWAEVTPFQVVAEDVTWSLVHVRIVYHEVSFDGSTGDPIDNIMLLGVARERYLDDESNEVVNYYSCYLEHNSANGGSWAVASRYPSLDTIDPIFGERFSVEMSLFGDTDLSPRMMQYLSPPAGMSQTPFGPYDGYYSGLP